MEQSCRTIQCDQARTNVIDRQNDDQTIEDEACDTGYYCQDTVDQPGRR